MLGSRPCGRFRAQNSIRGSGALFRVHALSSGPKCLVRGQVLSLGPRCSVQGLGLSAQFGDRCSVWGPGARVRAKVLGSVPRCSVQGLGARFGAPPGCSPPGLPPQAAPRAAPPGLPPGPPGLPPRATPQAAPLVWAPQVGPLAHRAGLPAWTLGPVKNYLPPFLKKLHETFFSIGTTWSAELRHSALKNIDWFQTYKAFKSNIVKKAQFHIHIRTRLKTLSVLRCRTRLQHSNVQQC